VNQLAGGTAAMQQMKERLEKDLMEVSNQFGSIFFSMFVILSFYGNLPLCSSFNRIVKIF